MKPWQLVLAVAAALVLVGIWTGDGRWALSGFVVAAALAVGGLGLLLANDYRRPAVEPEPGPGEEP